MRLREDLAAGIAALGLDIDDAAQAKLLAYVALLEKWNRTHNLTAIREPGRMVTHHLLDTLAVLPHLPQRRALRLIDVGSGGGLPGIPLAIARPDWDVTLLDSIRKKTTFLRQVAAELGLANVAIVTGRVEVYRPEFAFDVAISRAFAELAPFLAAARHLVHASGCLVVMKGGYPQAELAHLPANLRVAALPKLAVPGLDAERHLVIVEASAKTP
jgi:16S rRNA (guanine527-N7)-methyltransferase